MKKSMIAFIAAAFAIVSSMPALAADVDAKVSKCDGNKITVTVAEDVDWLKKGAPVKVKGVAGTVAEISGSTVVIKSKKAAECKAGENVNVVKGVKESQGC
jgi:hypothetical protein